MPEGIRLHEGNCLVGMRKRTLEKDGLDTALFLGKFAEDESLPYNVYMDSLYPHVVFVCGTRGSGKSYTLGVIAEELVEKNPHIGIVIIDPIGVFWSMKQKNNQDKEMEMLEEWGLAPKDYPVKVMIPEGVADRVPKGTYDTTFSIPISDLTVDDWALTFGIGRFKPSMLLLEQALSKMGDSFSITDIVHLVGSSTELVSKDKGFATQTRRSLTSRLEASKEWGILSGDGTELSEVVVPGQVTVIDTSFLEEEVANLVIGVISRKMLEARKMAVRVGKGEIPPPWLLIDEAHTAIPSRSKTAASDSIIEYVKQGRRPGCSIVLATQQPSAVDSRVLSQLDILITHKLVFKDDIGAVFKRMPTSVIKDMRKVDFVRNLPMGKAMVGDKEEFTSRALVMQVRPRKSQHEGRAIPSNEMKLGTVEKTDSKTKDEMDTVAIIQSDLTVADIEKTADELRRRKFLIFGEDEEISKRIMVGWPVWDAEVRYPTEKFAGSIMFDAVTGELMNGKAEGLLHLLGLKPVQQRILAHAQRQKEFSELAKEVGLDEKSLKKQLKKLLEKGLMRSSTREDEKFYKALKKVKIPELDDAGSNLKTENRRVKKLVDPVIDRNDIYQILELWGSPRIKKIELVYQPLWLYVMSNGKTRLELVDGLNGKKSSKIEHFKPIFERIVAGE